MRSPRLLKKGPAWVVHALLDRLAEGALDVALIPSIEFFQNPAYTIVSDACIGFPDAGAMSVTVIVNAMKDYILG